MTKLLTYCAVAMVAIFAVQYAHGQWAEIRPIPNLSERAGGGHPVQLANGDVLIFFAESGEVTSDPGVFPPTGDSALARVSRTTDDGSTWIAPSIFATAGANAVTGISMTNVAVLPNGDLVVIVYRQLDIFPNFAAIYEVWSSNDGGSSWTQPSSFPFPFPEGLGDINLAASPDGLLIFSYTEADLSGIRQITLRTSSDGGLSWSDPGLATAFASSFDNCGHDLSASTASDLLIVYTDCVFGQGPGVLYQLQSADGGATWSAPAQTLTRQVDFSLGQNLAYTSDGTTWLIYTNGDHLNYVSSLDGGATWSASTQWTQLDRNISASCSDVDGDPFCVISRSELPPSEDHPQTMWVGKPGKSADVTGVGIVEAGDAVPGRYSLDQNYPNPFNPTTTVSFAIPEEAHVTLTVVDMLGREVRVLASGSRPAGHHKVAFDASGLPSGVFLYHLQAGDFVQSRRMVLLK